MGGLLLDKYYSEQASKIMQTSKPALELLTSDAIYRENPGAVPPAMRRVSHPAAGIADIDQ